MSFKQPQLWDALQHPRDISSDTVAEMEATLDKYPYFQVLYTLIAKAKHDQQTPDAYESLGKAAVYAPNRQLLRQVFYDELLLIPSDSNEPSLPVVDIPPEVDAQEAPDLPPGVDDPAAEDEHYPIEVDETPAESVDASTEEDASIEEVDTQEIDDEEANTEEVATQAIALEEVYTEEVAPEEANTEEAIDPQEANTEEVDIEEADTEEVNIEEEIATEEATPEEADSLREELAHTLHVLQDSKEQLPDSVESTDPADEAATEASSPLLDRLDRISDEPTPHNSNQSMQQGIIDRFVKANPSIIRDSSPEGTDEADLSAGSTELPDDIVTENLAEIMLKQGKTSKAVDLYQKLMLKYPEKRAYFAQKIDQLTNN